MLYQRTKGEIEVNEGEKGVNEGEARGEADGRWWKKYKVQEAGIKDEDEVEDLRCISYIIKNTHAYVLNTL